MVLLGGELKVLSDGPMGRSYETFRFELLENRQLRWRAAKGDLTRLHGSINMSGASVHPMPSASQPTPSKSGAGSSSAASQLSMEIRAPYKKPLRLIARNERDFDAWCSIFQTIGCVMRIPGYEVRTISSAASLMPSSVLLPGEVSRQAAVSARAQASAAKATPPSGSPPSSASPNTLPPFLSDAADGDSGGHPRALKSALRKSVSPGLSSQAQLQQSPVTSSPGTAAYQPRSSSALSGYIDSGLPSDDGASSGGASASASGKKRRVRYADDETDGVEAGDDTGTSAAAAGAGHDHDEDGQFETDVFDETAYVDDDGEQDSPPDGYRRPTSGGSGLARRISEYSGFQNSKPRTDLPLALSQVPPVPTLSAAPAISANNSAEEFELEVELEAEEASARGNTGRRSRDSAAALPADASTVSQQQSSVEQVLKIARRNLGINEEVLLAVEPQQPPLSPDAPLVGSEDSASRTAKASADDDAKRRSSSLFSAGSSQSGGSTADGSVRSNYTFLLQPVSPSAGQQPVFAVAEGSISSSGRGKSPQAGLVVKPTLRHYTVEVPLEASSSTGNLTLDTSPKPSSAAAAAGIGASASFSFAAKDAPLIKAASPSLPSSPLHSQSFSRSSSSAILAAATAMSVNARPMPLVAVEASPRSPFSPEEEAKATSAEASPLEAQVASPDSPYRAYRAESVASVSSIENDRALVEAVPSSAGLTVFSFYSVEQADQDEKPASRSAEGVVTPRPPSVSSPLEPPSGPSTAPVLPSKSASKTAPSGTTSAVTVPQLLLEEMETIKLMAVMEGPESVNPRPPAAMPGDEGSALVIVPLVPSTIMRISNDDGSSGGSGRPMRPLPTRQSSSTGGTPPSRSSGGEGSGPASNKSSPESVFGGANGGIASLPSSSAFRPARSSTASTDAAIIASEAIAAAAVSSSPSAEKAVSVDTETVAVATQEPPQPSPIRSEERRHSQMLMQRFGSGRSVAMAQAKKKPAGQDESSDGASSFSSSLKRPQSGRQSASASPAAATSRFTPRSTGSRGQSGSPKPITSPRSSPKGSPVASKSDAATGLSSSSSASAYSVTSSLGLAADDDASRNGTTDTASLTPVALQFTAPAEASSPQTAREMVITPERKSSPQASARPPSVRSSPAASPSAGSGSSPRSAPSSRGRPASRGTKSPSGPITPGPVSPSQVNAAPIAAASSNNQLPDQDGSRASSSHSSKSVESSSSSSSANNGDTANDAASITGSGANGLRVVKLLHEAAQELEAVQNHHHHHEHEHEHQGEAVHRGRHIPLSTGLPSRPAPQLPASAFSPSGAGNSGLVKGVRHLPPTIAAFTAGVTFAVPVLPTSNVLFDVANGQQQHQAGQSLSSPLAAAAAEAAKSLPDGLLLELAAKADNVGAATEVGRPQSANKPALLFDGAAPETDDSGHLPISPPTKAAASAAIPLALGTPASTSEFVVAPANEEFTLAQMSPASPGGMPWTTLQRPDAVQPPQLPKRAGYGEKQREEAAPSSELVPAVAASSVAAMSTPPVTASYLTRLLRPLAQEDLIRELQLEAAGSGAVAADAAADSSSIAPVTPAATKKSLGAASGQRQEAQSPLLTLGKEACSAIRLLGKNLAVLPQTKLLGLLRLAFDAPRGGSSDVASSAFDEDLSALLMAAADCSKALRSTSAPRADGSANEEEDERETILAVLKPLLAHPVRTSLRSLASVLVHSAMSSQSADSTSAAVSGPLADMLPPVEPLETRERESLSRLVAEAEEANNAVKRRLRQLAGASNGGVLVADDGSFDVNPDRDAIKATPAEVSAAAILLADLVVTKSLQASPAAAATDDASGREVMSASSGAPATPGQQLSDKLAETKKAESGTRTSPKTVEQIKKRYKAHLSPIAALLPTSSSSPSSSSDGASGNTGASAFSAGLKLTPAQAERLKQHLSPFFPPTPVARAAAAAAPSTPSSAAAPALPRGAITSPLKSVTAAAAAARHHKETEIAAKFHEEEAMAAAAASMSAPSLSPRTTAAVLARLALYQQQMASPAPSPPTSARSASSEETADGAAGAEAQLVEPSTVAVQGVTPVRLAPSRAPPPPPTAPAAAPSSASATLSAEEAETVVALASFFAHNDPSRCDAILLKGLWDAHCVNDGTSGNHSEDDDKATAQRIWKGLALEYGADAVAPYYRLPAPQQQPAKVSSPAAPAPQSPAPESNGASAVSTSATPDKASDESERVAESPATPALSEAEAPAADIGTAVAAVPAALPVSEPAVAPVPAPPARTPLVEEHAKLMAALGDDVKSLDEDDDDEQPVGAAHRPGSLPAKNEQQDPGKKVDDDDKEDDDKEDDELVAAAAAPTPTRTPSSPPVARPASDEEEESQGGSPGEPESSNEDDEARSGQKPADDNAFPPLLSPLALAAPPRRPSLVAPQPAAPSSAAASPPTTASESPAVEAAPVAAKLAVNEGDGEEEEEERSMIQAQLRALEAELEQQDKEEREREARVVAATSSPASSASSSASASASARRASALLVKALQQHPDALASLALSEESAKYTLEPEDADKAARVIEASAKRRESIALRTKSQQLDSTANSSSSSSASSSSSSASSAASERGDSSATEASAPITGRDLPWSAPPILPVSQLRRASSRKSLGLNVAGALLAAEGSSATSGSVPTPSEQGSILPIRPLATKRTAAILEVAEDGSEGNDAENERGSASAASAAKSAGSARDANAARRLPPWSPGAGSLAKARNSIREPRSASPDGSIQDEQDRNSTTRRQDGMAGPRSVGGSATTARSTSARGPKLSTTRRAESRERKEEAAKKGLPKGKFFVDPDREVGDEDMDDNEEEGGVAEPTGDAVVSADIEVFKQQVQRALVRAVNDGSLDDLLLLSASSDPSSAQALALTNEQAASVLEALLQRDRELEKLEERRQTRSIRRESFRVLTGQAAGPLEQPPLQPQQSGNTSRSSSPRASSRGSQSQRGRSPGLTRKATQLELIQGGRPIYKDLPAVTVGTVRREGYQALQPQTSQQGRRTSRSPNSKGSADRSLSASPALGKGSAGGSAGGRLSPYSSFLMNNRGSFRFNNVTPRSASFSAGSGAPGLLKTRSLAPRLHAQGHFERFIRIPGTQDERAKKREAGWVRWPGGYPTSFQAPLGKNASGVPGHYEVGYGGLPHAAALILGQNAWVPSADEKVSRINPPAGDTPLSPIVPPLSMILRHLQHGGGDAAIQFMHERLRKKRAMMRTRSGSPRSFKSFQQLQQRAQSPRSLSKGGSRLEHRASLSFRYKGGAGADDFSKALESIRKDESNGASAVKPKKGEKSALDAAAEASAIQDWLDYAREAGIDLGDSLALPTKRYIQPWKRGKAHHPELFGKPGTASSPSAGSATPSAQSSRQGVSAASNSQEEAVGDYVFLDANLSRDSQLKADRDRIRGISHTSRRNLLELVADEERSRSASPSAAAAAVAVAGTATKSSARGRHSGRRLSHGSLGSHSDRSGPILASPHVHYSNSTSAGYSHVDSLAAAVAAVGHDDEDDQYSSSDSELSAAPERKTPWRGDVDDADDRDEDHHAEADHAAEQEEHAPPSPTAEELAFLADHPDSYAVKAIQRKVAASALFARRKAEKAAQAEQKRRAAKAKEVADKLKNLLTQGVPGAAELAANAEPQADQQPAAGGDATARKKKQKAPWAGTGRNWPKPLVVKGGGGAIKTASPAVANVASASAAVPSAPPAVDSAAAPVVTPRPAKQPKRRERRLSERTADSNGSKRARAALPPELAAAAADAPPLELRVKRVNVTIDGADKAVEQWLASIGFSSQQDIDAAKRLICSLEKWTLAAKQIVGIVAPPVPDEAKEAARKAHVHTSASIVASPAQAASHQKGKGGGKLVAIDAQDGNSDPGANQHGHTWAWAPVEVEVPWPIRLQDLAYLSAAEVLNAGYSNNNDDDGTAPQLSFAQREVLLAASRALRGVVDNAPEPNTSGGGSLPAAERTLDVITALQSSLSPSLSLQLRAQVVDLQSYLQKQVSKTRAESRKRAMQTIIAATSTAGNGAPMEGDANDVDAAFVGSRAVKGVGHITSPNAVSTIAAALAQAASALASAEEAVALSGPLSGTTATLDAGTMPTFAGNMLVVPGATRKPTISPTSRRSVGGGSFSPRSTGSGGSLPHKSSFRSPRNTSTMPAFTVTIVENDDEDAATLTSTSSDDDDDDDATKKRSAAAKLSSSKKLSPSLSGSLSASKKRVIFFEEEAAMEEGKLRQASGKGVQQQGEPKPEAPTQEEEQQKLGKRLGSIAVPVAASTTPSPQKAAASGSSPASVGVPFVAGQLQLQKFVLFAEPSEEADSAPAHVEASKTAATASSPAGKAAPVVDVEAASSSADISLDSSLFDGTDTDATGSSSMDDEDGGDLIDALLKRKMKAADRGKANGKGASPAPPPAPPRSTDKSHPSGLAHSLLKPQELDLLLQRAKARRSSNTDVLQRARVPGSAVANLPKPLHFASKLSAAASNATQDASGESSNSSSAASVASSSSASGALHAAPRTYHSSAVHAPSTSAVQDQVHKRLSQRRTRASEMKAVLVERGAAEARALFKVVPPAGASLPPHGVLGAPTDVSEVAVSVLVEAANAVSEAAAAAATMDDSEAQHGVGFSTEHDDDDDEQEQPTDAGSDAEEEVQQDEEGQEIEDDQVTASDIQDTEESVVDEEHRFTGLEIAAPAGIASAGSEVPSSPAEAAGFVMASPPSSQNSSVFPPSSPPLSASLSSSRAESAGSGVAVSSGSSPQGLPMTLTALAGDVVRGKDADDGVKVVFSPSLRPSIGGGGGGSGNSTPRVSTPRASSMGGSALSAALSPLRLAAANAKAAAASAPAAAGSEEMVSWLASVGLQRLSGSLADAGITQLAQVAFLTPKALNDLTGSIDNEDALALLAARKGLLRKLAEDTF